KKQLTRIMSASALFNAVWIADDSFAFEDGLGGKAAVRVWKAGKVTTLRLPHGGGLRFVPELPTCGAEWEDSIADGKGILCDEHSCGFGRPSRRRGLRRRFRDGQRW